MSKNNGSTNIKQLAESIKASDTSDFNVTDRTFSSKEMSPRTMFMLATYNVLLTKFVNDNGNASIIMRRQQYSVEEINNILALCKVVGECFDGLKTPLDAE